MELRVCHVCHGDRVANRATVLQQKTLRPNQFEILPGIREAVEARVRKAGYGTHSMLRTKASLIYRRTKNQRAAQFGQLQTIEDFVHCGHLTVRTAILDRARGPPRWDLPDAGAGGGDPALSPHRSTSSTNAPLGQPDLGPSAAVDAR